MIRVIILAAGEGVRWGNYRGTPKHKAIVEGEVLIERTVRQFQKYTKDIVIVGSDESYKMDGTSLYIPEFDESWKDMGKLWSSRDIWSDGRTVLVFGDVYFTDKAVKVIMNSRQDLIFFLRKQGSALTGKRGGEIFGLAFAGGMRKTLSDYIYNLIKSGDAIKAGTWYLYNTLIRTYDHKLYTKINDWTEDFDYPRDLDRWEKSRKS